MRSKDLKTLSVLIVSLLAIEFCCGCSSLSSRGEPEFVPDAFLIDRTSAYPEWVNDYGDAIRCDDPALDHYVLIPADDLYKLEMKFQRCASWK
jgi:hypothetical protein